MISVEQVSVLFGAFTLFDDINFVISDKDRIGLTGKNGAGKSTLLKILNGLEEPTKGKITYPNHITIGYLPQDMNFENTQNVYEEAKQAFSEVLSLKEEIQKIGDEIATRTDYESDAYNKLIHQLSEKNERLEILDGNNLEAGIEQTLMGLGFKRSDFTRHTSEFSGGWRMRIELAKILLRKPKVLLLDEPTNHLDIESIQWLEDFLKTYPGAVLLISHDRTFLDNVTTRTIELSLGKAYDYKVPYTKYVELRKERREQQKAAYENQQKMIEDTEKFIERFRYKATKAVQVQSRIKHLEKIDRIEIDEEDKSAINIKFPPAPRSGDVVVSTKEMSKAYGHLQVLNDIDLTIERGERIAFVGRNGEGKSTLVKVIMNEIDYTGECKIGHNVSIGYFAQNQANLMDENKTVFETLDEVAVGDIRTKIRDILGAFLFGGESIDKKVKVLSGGERTRLAIAKLLLEPYSLLVFDEPTNHLDLISKDVLKSALLNYNGTVILVSHDRDFLNGLTSKIYEFRDKKVKEHGGDIFEFLQKKRMESFRELEQKVAVKKEAVEEEAPSQNKLNYLERKEIDKAIRKVKNQTAKCEENIERLEAEIEEINVKLSNPAEFSDQIDELYTQYEAKKTELNTEMETWENLSIELDELEEKKNQ